MAVLTSAERGSEAGLMSGSWAGFQYFLVTVVGGHILSKFSFFLCKPGGEWESAS